MKYYKVLSENGYACHGGNLKWPLPTEEGPGKWVPKIDSPVLCTRGYHLCRRQDIVHWLNESIWEVELAPNAIIIEGDNKVVTSGPVRLVRQLPWNERIARLFACDCAERVLHLCGDDPRPHEAIAVSRRYAEGSASAIELSAAAAAGYAAGYAARDAAWDAARAAAGDAAGDAARDAAWEAARDAAWDAAWAAAKDEERAWQTDRLFQYIEGEIS